MIITPFSTFSSTSLQAIVKFGVIYFFLCLTCWRRLTAPIVVDLRGSSTKALHFVIVRLLASLERWNCWVHLHWLLTVWRLFKVEVFKRGDHSDNIRVLQPCHNLNFLHLVMLGNLVCKFFLLQRNRLQRIYLVVSFEAYLSNGAKSSATQHFQHFKIFLFQVVENSSATHRISSSLFALLLNNYLFLLILLLRRRRLLKEHIVTFAQLRSVLALLVLHLLCCIVVIFHLFLLLWIIYMGFYFLLFV